MQQVNLRVELELGAFRGFQRVLREELRRCFESLLVSLVVEKVRVGLHQEHLGGIAPRHALGANAGLDILMTQVIKSIRLRSWHHRRRRLRRGASLLPPPLAP